MLAVDVFGIGGQVEVPIKAALFLVLGAVIFVANLRLARSNLEVKIERNQLSSVVTNLKDGIVAYDPNFKILMFNPAAEEIFGVRVADVLGQYFDTGRVQAAAFSEDGADDVSFARADGHSPFRAGRLSADQRSFF